MYQLKLFGSPTLSRGDVALTGPPVQRHRIALLALLALAPGRCMSRDKLIAWLWPERDTRNGRNLLKSATYVLRAELGENALVSANDQLRLNGQVVETDVTAFREDIARLDFEQAVRRYRGSFLDGFFLSGAPDFTEWAELERARLAGEYAGALEKVALAREEALDYTGAVEWWRKRAECDPYDTRVALRLIQALDASGNPAAGLQHAAIHRQLQQEEFGTDAGPELQAAVERLRAREPLMSARSPSPPMSALPSSPPVPSEQAARTEPETSPTKSVDEAPSTRKRWLRPLAAAAVLALLTTLLLLARPGSAGEAASIAVLPFSSLSTDPDDEYFSDGLTDEVITRLSALDGLKVISRTSAMYYKGNRKPVRDVARELDVRHVLEGSVRRRGDAVRITAQLIDAEKDEHVWSESYDYSLHDSFHVQEQIARAVARVLEVRLGAREARQLSRRGTSDPEAYELYRRGRYLWSMRTREGHEQALAYFRQAIARDPQYADAYGASAYLYATAHQFGFLQIPEAEVQAQIAAAAERALAHDEESADAHTALAAAFWYQRNWPGVERELRRALELNPGDAVARSWYALLLGGMGRLQEAVTHARRAYEVDPFAIEISLNLGWACYLLRDFACAADQFRRTLELNPSWWMIYRRHGMTLAATGRLTAAVDTLRAGLERQPDNVGLQLSLAYVYALADNASAARELLANAEDRPPFDVALVYVALEEPDSALALLNGADWRFSWRAALYDPALAPLWQHPQFEQLIARVESEMAVR